VEEEEEEEEDLNQLDARPRRVVRFSLIQTISLTMSLITPTLPPLGRRNLAPSRSTLEDCSSFVDAGIACHSKLPG